MPDTPQPVLIIGVDGATLDYLELHLSADTTPNLYEMYQQGVRAHLLSVTPPMTPAAWTSMVTGVSPARHGIHGWFCPLGKDYALRPVTSNNIHYKSLWHLLSDTNYTVGIANVPMTYPPLQVQGFFVSGFDSPFAIPDWAQPFCFPPSLLEESKSLGMVYKLIELLDPDSTDPISDPAYYFNRRLDLLDLNDHLRCWGKMEQDRARAFAHWIARYRPDFMMVVFHLIDYFAHRAPAASEIMEYAFRYLDSCIGILRAACPANTRLIVASDHGVTEIRSLFFINNWLRDNGYLAFAPHVADIMLPVIVDHLLGLSDLPIQRQHLAQYVDTMIGRWRKLPTDTRTSLTRIGKQFFPGCEVAHSNHYLCTLTMPPGGHRVAQR